LRTHSPDEKSHPLPLTRPAVRAGRGVKKARAQQMLTMAQPRQKYVDAIAQLEKLLFAQQPGNNAEIPL
jgi:hypothetical protein